MAPLLHRAAAPFLTRFCPSSSCFAAHSHPCIASTVRCCQFDPSLVQIQRLQDMRSRQADQGAPLRAKWPTECMPDSLDLDNILHANAIFISLSTFSPPVRTALSQTSPPTFCSRPAPRPLSAYAGVAVERSLGAIISGVAEGIACWAHSPKFHGSKPRSAIFL